MKLLNSWDALDYGIYFFQKFWLFVGADDF